jgi:hypothetical protein
MVCRVQRDTRQRGPHPGERQTPKLLYSAVHAIKHTVDTLPCPAVTGTRQTTSAVAVTAVTTLPCACTRQMACRVQKLVCRVNGPHGRGMDSGSDGSASLEQIDTYTCTQCIKRLVIISRYIFLRIRSE